MPRVLVHAIRIKHKGTPWHRPSEYRRAGLKMPFDDNGEPLTIEVSPKVLRQLQADPIVHVEELEP